MPALEAVAVKVMATPGQDGLLPPVSAILTEGVDVRLTLNVMAFDVAGLPVTPTKFDVISQVIICPLVILELVYVALFVPTFAPFIFH